MSFPVWPPLGAHALQWLYKLSLSSSPVGGAPPRQARTICVLVSCATKYRAWQLARRETRTYGDCIALLRFHTVPLIYQPLSPYRKLDKTGTNANRGRWSDALWKSKVPFLFLIAASVLASWRREENRGYAASSARSTRQSREDHCSAAAAIATGSRGPRGSLSGPRLDAPCLRRLSRSPRWGRPKSSTTSTAKRRHIWWNYRCPRTKSLWQTSKMSSRNQITNSSSNLWTMTSGNWKGLLCLTWGQHNTGGFSTLVQLD